MGNDGVRKIVVLSAANQDSAKAQAINLVNHLKTRKADEGKKVSFGRLVHTLASRRSHLEWRLALLAGSTEELLEALNVSRLEARKIPTKKAKLGFVFSGQGSQWQGMAQELMRDFSVFAAVVEESETYLQKLGATWSLKGKQTATHCMLACLLITQTCYVVHHPWTFTIRKSVSRLLPRYRLVSSRCSNHGALSLQRSLATRPVKLLPRTPLAPYPYGLLSLLHTIEVDLHRLSIMGNMVSVEPCWP